MRRRALALTGIAVALGGVLIYLLGLAPLEAPSWAFTRLGGALLYVLGAVLGVVIALAVSALLM